MRTLHFFLRRPLRPRSAGLRVGLRLQHHQHGSPHKEYFQHPSQYPSTTSTVRPPASASSPYQQPVVSDTTLRAKKPPLFRRTIRGLLLINLGLLLGWTTGTAVITWEYIQPAFEPGSEQDQELYESIEEMLEDSQIVESLRGRGWIESPASNAREMAGVQDRHLVHDTLSGVQGVTTRHFRSPYNDLSMLVVFTGFGVEGWPDTVHGGTISTLAREAFDKHLQPLVERENFKVQDVQSAYHSFVKPMRPGEIYAILVETDHMCAQPPEIGTETTSQHVVHYKANVFLMSTDDIPILSQGPNPSGPGVVKNLELGDGVLHALTSYDVYLDSPRFARGSDELDQQYQYRMLDEIARITKQASNPTNQVSRSPHKR